MGRHRRGGAARPPCHRTCSRQWRSLGPPRPAATPAAADQLDAAGGNPQGPGDRRRPAAPGSGSVGPARGAVRAGQGQRMRAQGLAEGGPVAAADHLRLGKGRLLRAHPRPPGRQARGGDGALCGQEPRQQASPLARGPGPGAAAGRLPRPRGGQLPAAGPALPLRGERLGEHGPGPAQHQPLRRGAAQPQGSRTAAAHAADRAQHCVQPAQPRRLEERGGTAPPALHGRHPRRGSRKAARQFAGAAGILPDAAGASQGPAGNAHHRTRRGPRPGSACRTGPPPGPTCGWASRNSPGRPCSSKPPPSLPSSSTKASSSARTPARPWSSSIWRRWRGCGANSAAGTAAWKPPKRR
jgi:hypothetical protein